MNVAAEVSAALVASFDMPNVPAVVEDHPVGDDILPHVALPLPATNLLEPSPPRGSPAVMAQGDCCKMSGKFILPCVMADVAVEVVGGRVQNVAEIEGLLRGMEGMLGGGDHMSINIRRSEVRADEYFVAFETCFSRFFQRIFRYRGPVGCYEVMFPGLGSARTLCLEVLEVDGGLLRLADASVTALKEGGFEDFHFSVYLDGDYKERQNMWLQVLAPHVPHVAPCRAPSGTLREGHSIYLMELIERPY